MSEEFKSPAYFESSTEHSHQVALFAAIAMYAGGESMGGELRRRAEALKEHAKAYAQDSCVETFEDEAERLLRIGNALRWIHAVPNGGDRGEESKSKDRRTAMIRGGQMKAEGVKRGVSDVDIPAARHGYHGFKIEMKAPGKIKGESKEQKAYGSYLAEEGYLYGVFDSWREAFKAIMWYFGFEHTLEWEL